MRISTKGEYGIRALLELSKRYGAGYVQSTEIAGVRGIPENYLYQLLIRSRRGPQGGHMLARAPSAISVADAVIALEGPLAPIACVQTDIEDDCPYSCNCAMRGVWERVTDSTHEILRQTTFDTLVDRERQLEQSTAG
jgi:Rrf2 family cysteine metabolism transcriptional repressor